MSEKETIKTIKAFMGLVNKGVISFSRDDNGELIPILMVDDKHGYPITFK